jgi:plastocyanin
MTRTSLLSVVLPLSVLACIGLSSISGCGGGANADVSVAVKAADTTEDPDVSGQQTGTTSPAVEGKSGSFIGKVAITGAFSELDPLIKQGDSSAKDAEVCAAENVPDQRLVVGGDNGVANVFLFMDKVPRALKNLPVPEEALIFDQKTCTFLPHAMVVRAGQKIQVYNSDPAAHNTHTKSVVNGEFNSLVKAGDRSGSVEFSYKKAEKQPISVVCDFHSWMKAYHFPIDHPFATVTNADGTFEIKDIPPGKYRFKIWHSGKYLERKVEVVIKPGSPTKMDFSYSAQKLLAGK